VFFRFPLLVWWFGHHTETLFTKRRVFGICLILTLYLAPFAPRNPLGRKADHSSVVLAVLVLGMLVLGMALVSRGVAIQKSLSILKITRFLAKIW
jgi:hypothetical protein